MRAAIYARVSTSDGRQDAGMQTRELREYLERREWELVEEYVDTVTGSRERRPSLDKLMQDAHRRRFDAVIVWRFDRSRDRCRIFCER